MPVILLIFGFALLIKGADWLVDGASSLAKRLGIPALVIGLTVVAFGTSAPELVVNVVASLGGNADIAIGNVIGSNIANILLILGVAAVIRPLAISHGTVWKEIPFSILAAAVVWVAVNDFLIDGRTFSELSRSDGLILLSFFVIFLYYIFSLSRKGERIRMDGEKTPADRSLAIAIGMTVGGLVGLVVGGQWAVGGASVLARHFGVSESVIGLTVVAVGTSLPELFTSVVAARKGNIDIAVGNAVGSNIFNMLMVLGISSLIRPLPFGMAMNVDLMMTVVASLFLFSVMFLGRRHVVERRQGIAFLVMYLAYVCFLVARETMA